MSNTVRPSDFYSDPQGRKYWATMQDVIEPLLAFLSTKEAVRRMQESEQVHRRPALAGVVVDLENGILKRRFERNGRQRTRRLRQGVGVAVRMVMEEAGWRKTGRQGTLGQPDSANADGPNKTGLSKWFTKAERYADCSD